MEEIDVDALLDAQSSDEDDGDLPELGRSIDDILNDADASEDDFLQVSVSNGELDKDGEKTANRSFDVSSRPPRNLSISSSKDSAGPGVRRTTTSNLNSETSSQEMILHGAVTRDIDNNDKVESGSSSKFWPGIEQHNLKLDQDKDSGHDRGIVSPELPFDGRLLVSVSMKNQRMWEFGSKAPPLGAAFPFYPVSPMVAPRPSPRPGAAVAAAAAASRHLVSPRLNSRAATYSRSGSAINRSSIPDNSQLVAGTPDSIVRDVSNVELLITENPKIAQEDSEITVNLQEESTELASFVSVTIAGETVDEENDKSQGSMTEVQAEDYVVNVDLPAPSEGLQEEEFKEETWTADATTSDITAVDVAEDDMIAVEIINEKLAQDNKLDELITSSSQESSEFETVLGEPVGVHENAFEAVHPAQPHSPLHEAEELEKWAANSGLHLEEGAHAQPMQLEGIQRGPPAIGLLQLDCGGPLSFALSSIAMMRDHGSPRALAVHTNFLAVGMSKGTVLLAPSKYSATRTADDNETKVVLLSNATDKSHASVSVLCFSHLGDLLLAGYSNGSVTLWDVAKAAVAKAVTGEHHSVIVHAAFIGQDASTGRQLKVITADSKGVVLLHTFTLVPLLRRFSVTTQCLLDGQRTGIVLSLSPLLPDESTVSSVGSNAALSAGGAVSGTDVGRRFLYDGSSADEAGGLVVFVTQQIALVFRLVPTLEICAKLTRPDGVGEGAIPYTSWRRIPSKSTASESSNANSGMSKPADSDKNSAMENSTQAQDNNFPLLALAWGKKVLILQLQKTELKTLVQWDLDNKAAGVAWLSEHMLIVATAKAELCLFTKGGLELERAAMREDQGGLGALIFHTYFLDSCNNPEKVYANSIGVRGAAFYFLGSSKLWRARLLPWQDRIKALQDAGDWMGAFQIAMELFDGRARGVTGLPTGLRAMQEALTPNLLALLSAYIDEAFAYVRLALGLPNHSSTDLPVEDADSLTQVAREQYARVGGVAIEFCVHIHRTDVLFENVFKKFEAVGQAATFLELLEPYILKDMLGGLPPEIMQSLVVHYSGRGWLQRVEQCILHMDISSLDFNQVMRLCREHGLFSALIYLFNKGLNDFKSPLEELLVAVQDQSRPNARYLGYKLLVYLKYCFSGLAFPPGRGFLPPGQLAYLKAQLLEYLLDPEGSVKDAAMADSVNVAYPRLCYLLNLDVIATLDVLKMAFSNGSVSDDINQAVEKDLVQLMVDALVHIVETVLCMEAGSEMKIGHVLEFIASFVSTRAACIPPTTLHRILEHFCLAVTPAFPKSSSRDQEDLMVALLKAVPAADWNPDSVLQLAEKAHFWQVSALVHTREGDHAGALSSYLKDLSRPYHTFSYVLSMLHAEDGLKSTALADFRAAVIARIPQLVQQSREATLFLVLEYFYDEVKDIMKTLESFPMSLFYFLKAVMEVQSYHVEPAPDVSHMDPEVVEDTEAWNNHKDEPWSDHARVASLLDRSYLEISDQMVELYIELMCQLEPNSVLKFLQSYESYRLEQCLKVCQKYGVKDGAAFLLERVGDVGSALALVLADLTRLIHELDNAVAVQYSSASNALLDEIPEAKVIHAVGDAAISLCQRNTFRLDHQEAESLWFHLLDRFVHPLQRLVSSKPKAQLPLKERNSHHKWQVLETEGGGWDVLRRMLSKFVGDIVTGMLGYVPLHVILNKIISDHGNHEFGDFKGTILEMLSAYGYELAILGTAKRIIEADMFHNIVALRKGSARGFAPRIPMCSVCYRAFDEDHTNDEKQKGIGGDRNRGNLGLAIQIFSCGHAVHVACWDAEKTKSNSLRCPACLLHETGAYPTASGSILHDKQVRKSEQPAEGQSTTRMQRTLEAAAETNGISRFELLKSLQNGQGLPETNAGLRLNLSPPVVYKHGSNAATSSRPSSGSSYAQRSVQLKGSATVQKQQGKARVPSMFQLAGIGSQK